MKPKDLSRATRSYSVTKYSSEGSSKEERKVIVEQPFQLMINDDLLATVMCTPIQLEEFLIGFLFAQGIIDNGRQIERSLIDIDKGLLWAQVRNPASISLTKSIITSGCTGGIMLDDYKEPGPLEKQKLPDVNAISSLMKQMIDSAEIYKESGGLHSACLADKNKIIFQAEDIGRHNCIDKVIGFLIINNIETKGKIVLTTGRLSLEAVVKMARANINFLVSRTAATSLAIDLANKLNITLLGYVRAGKATIY